MDAPVSPRLLRLLPRLFGSLNLASAFVVALGVFAGLPARWWVVDLPAALIVALLAAAGIGLVAGFSWGERIARVASLVTLALGLALVTALVISASYLSGIYMPVGRGGAIILVLVAALALPYLVALPASQLLWLGPPRRPAPAPAPGEGEPVTPRALGRLLAAYLALLVVVAFGVHHASALRLGDGAHVRSAWRKGELTARTVNAPLAQAPETLVVDEHVIGEGAVLTSIEPVFALSLVAGVDGLEATWQGRTVYLTPDELLSHQAYDKGITIPALTLSLGTDVQLAEALLAQELAISVDDLRAHAEIRRIRIERTGSIARIGAAARTPDEVTPASLREAAVAAASYLARGVGPDGRFRYIVDATTDRTLPGYDWPRHSGATLFLAQAAEVSAQPLIREAALRSARYLRDKATQDCGAFRCVGADSLADLGSTALAVLAMAEVAQSGLDPSFRAPAEELAKFLRAQQRPDGEYMHFYDRRANQPLDLQVLYYSGEATLALARMYALTKDDADLDAARRGLAHLVGPAWSFFGNRYYFGEEHWTCQAMSDLWSVAPNPAALDFCERWRAYDANMMFAPGDTPLDVDGAFGVGPIVTPRLTPVGNRTEAGVATLDAMIRANVEPTRREALAAQLRRSFALLMRQQFRPGRYYLFANVDDVIGAMPGSSVDWQLRIDYAQHAGSAMLRAASVL